MVSNQHALVDQCALNETAGATAQTGFHWIWWISIFNLVFSICCFGAAFLMRRRWLEMNRARHDLYLQNERLRAEIHTLRSTVIDVDWKRKDMELQMMEHERIREAERQVDQRTIRMASGLLDRISEELTILTGFFMYTPPQEGTAGIAAIGAVI